MKKLFLSMILLALPLVAGAYDAEVDGIYYNLIPKGNVAEVTFGNMKYSGSVNIPEKITYESVEYSVITIGDYAFNDCSGLTSVIIPKSVTFIGNYAFNQCVGFTSVSIPNSVTRIGEGAFYGCSGLTSMTIPNSVTKIGVAAFRYCSGLTSLTIGNSVTSIGSNAFEECRSLTTIVIPNTVTSIGNYAFRYCSGLASVTIPNSVTRIGEGAFYGCSGLTSMTIPKSVNSIGERAFDDCSGLTAIYITDLEAWCKMAFGEVTSNPLCYAHHLYLNGEEIKDLVIPNSVSSIGGLVFAECSGLTSVTIPNSVTAIGSYAFVNCSGLTSVTIPNSVISIDDGAFSYCSGLTSVIIPNSVTVIGNYAFTECSKLEEVYCLAELVPSTNSTVFEKSYPEYMTLYVPASALNTYKITEPWSEFGTILPISSETKIEYTTMQEAEIKERYSLEGFKSGNPKKGLNIIRMSDGTVKKVVVK